MDGPSRRLLPDVKRMSPPTPPTPTVDGDVDPLGEVEPRGAACTTATLAAPRSSTSRESARPSDALVAAAGSWTEAAQAKYCPKATRLGPGPDLTTAHSAVERTAIARGQAYGAATNAEYDARARDAA